MDTPENSNATRSLVALRDPNAASNPVAARTSNRYGKQTLSVTKNEFIKMQAGAAPGSNSKALLLTLTVS